MEAIELEFQKVAMVKLLITPAEARECMGDFNKSEEPSRSGKKLYSLLQKIANSDE